VGLVERAAARFGDASAAIGDNSDVFHGGDLVPATLIASIDVFRHCERSEAKRSEAIQSEMPFWIASSLPLLAMTIGVSRSENFRLSAPAIAGRDRNARRF
jgi:hypothetical protein